MAASGSERFFESKSGDDQRITDEELVIEGLRTRRFAWSGARRARLVRRKELNRDASALDVLDAADPGANTLQTFTASDQRTLQIEFSNGKAKIDVSKVAPDFERPAQVEAILRAHLEPYVTVEEDAPPQGRWGGIVAYAGAFVRLWGVVLLICLAALAVDRIFDLGLL